MDEKQRNYGIDLLRLISMFMVCLLHTLGKGGVLDACQVGSLNYKVYWGIEVISYCAVDVFAIISGYVAFDKRSQKYEKIVLMWLQAFFYSFVLTVLLMAIGVSQRISVKQLIKCAFPVTFEQFWYFTGYFVLFFAMPVLNSILFSLDVSASKKMFIVLITLFSIPELIVDPFKLYWGYSALWLIILYCIGVLAKRINLFANKSTGLLIGILVGCNLITWICCNVGLRLMATYVSPLVIMSGFIWIVLFSRLQLKGTIIKRLAPLAFGVYLFHSNYIIFNRIIEGAFVFCTEKNIIVGVIYVFSIATGIFISGLIVEFIRVQLFKLLRIHMFAEWASALAVKYVDKMAMILN